MRLCDILPEVERADRSPADFSIGKPCMHTRNLQKKDVFFSENSTSYIEEAIRKGASALVIPADTTPISVPIPVFRVKNVRKAYALAWQRYTGHPEKGLRFFAVTGTNGKTSVAHFLSAIFRDAGYTVGTLGTIANFDGQMEHPSDYTTPPPEILYPLLLKMKENGVTHVVCEASSHAIIQERLAGISFETAIFTNLTHDHLDYHKTFEQYRFAKARLFRTASHALLNFDDASAKHMAWEAADEVYYYGKAPEAEGYIENPACDENGISYRLHFGEKTLSVRLPLVGAFHIPNSAAAICCALLANVSESAITHALQTLKAPSGRLERLETDTDYRVFIDYAHTPDALLRTLETLRPFTKTLTVLFGAGGDRDRAKRPEMGAVADRYCDRIVLTSDNPRSENPLSILKDIRQGIKQTPTVEIPDRKEAIEYALATAKRGEILLLAGKGHENYLIDKNGKHEFSERRIVTQYLERIGQKDVSQHE